MHGDIVFAIMVKTLILMAATRNAEDPASEGAM
jgi:hypothetical protein